MSKDRYPDNVEYLCMTWRRDKEKKFSYNCLTEGLEFGFEIEPRKPRRVYCWAKRPGCEFGLHRDYLVHGFTDKLFECIRITLEFALQDVLPYNGIMREIKRE